MSDKNILDHLLRGGIQGNATKYFRKSFGKFQIETGLTSFSVIEVAILAGMGGRDYRVFGMGFLWFFFDLYYWGD